MLLDKTWLGLFITATTTTTTTTATAAAIIIFVNNIIIILLVVIIILILGVFKRPGRPPPYYLGPVDPERIIDYYPERCNAGNRNYNERRKVCGFSKNALDKRPAKIERAPHYNLVHENFAGKCGSSKFPRVVLGKPKWDVNDVVRYRREGGDKSPEPAISAQQVLQWAHSLLCLVAQDLPTIVADEKDYRLCSYYACCADNGNYVRIEVWVKRGSYQNRKVWDRHKWDEAENKADHQDAKVSAFWVKWKQVLNADQLLNSLLLLLILSMPLQTLQPSLILARSKCILLACPSGQTVWPGCQRRFRLLSSPRIPASHTSRQEQIHPCPRLST